MLRGVTRLWRQAGRGPAGGFFGQAPGLNYASLGEMRERVSMLRKRGTNNPANVAKLLEAEMALLHLLANTGRKDDAEECLILGESLWQRLSDEARQHDSTVGGVAPTRGLGIHLCTTMRHASKKLSNDSAASLWVQRMGALHDSFMNLGDDPMQSNAAHDGDGFDNPDEAVFTKDGYKLGSKLRKFELDERGVRKKDTKWKHGNGVMDTFNGVRHPMTDLPWQRGKKGFKPNPDMGPRYTSGHK
mmetsp:Transcript_34129/g.105482  ORF Transcript_34129/g.105482 Transcript_34129/m.105482 type:complete len:245 (-) Transcript_34129:34-768(-)